MREAPPPPVERADDPELLLAMEDLELVAKGVVEGFMEGLHRSPFIGFSVEFDTHREYQRGDDVRHVNWKLWGRQDRLYVKQYNADTTLNLYLILAASGSMGGDHGPCTKWRYCTRAAATLADLALRGRDAAGVTVLDETVRYHVPARVRPDQFFEILALLQRAQPRGRTRLAAGLEEVARLSRRRGIVVLFSDLFEREDEVFAAMDQVRFHGHEVLLVQVLDPWERELPENGQFRFFDLETNMKVEAETATIRDAYHRLVHDWLESVRRSCEDRGIDRVLCTTADPLRDLLVDYLYKRAKAW